MPSLRWATLNRQLERQVQTQAAPLELAPQVLAQAASAQLELESASEQVASAAPDPTAVATDARFLRPDRWAGLAGESDGLAARSAATDARCAGIPLAAVLNNDSRPKQKSPACCGRGKSLGLGVLGVRLRTIRMY
jgi:hypothetical protein